MAAKAEIEDEFVDYVARFNSDKWAKIQKAMEAKGTTEKYPSLFLQKKAEEISTAEVNANEDEEVDDAQNGEEEDDDDAEMGDADEAKEEAT